MPWHPIVGMDGTENPRNPVRIRDGVLTEMRTGQTTQYNKNVRPNIWAINSVGRMFPWQGKRHGFESHMCPLNFGAVE